ncbi:MAG: polyhydroxyalkanoate synthesis repressor PhaR [Pseudomonadota bacterium]
MLKTPDVEKDATANVVIKKYANRRLYNTETSTYVTLDDLAQMVRNDRDFTVFDAKSGDDLTHAVLTQIIVDQESKGQTLLPIPFLRQLIRFYDDGIARMVPTYLQFSLEALVKEQEKYRSQFANAFGPTAAFEAYQEQARRNMAIFEQAMSLWTPFHGSGKPGEEGVAVDPAAAPQAASASDASKGKDTTAASPAVEPDLASVAAANNELGELKAQLAAMQRQIEQLSPTKD